MSDKGSRTDLIPQSPISESFVDIDNENNDFTIYWRNLNYTIRNSMSTRIMRRLQGFRETPKEKTILSGISGQVKSGELAAFMGPSGAGKSTLLECVVDRRVKGRSGHVMIDGDNLKNVKTSFIAQKNDFLKLLTVRESILYATKLQISTKLAEGTLEELQDHDGKRIVTKLGGHEYCSILTDRIIAEFGLEVCANNRVPNCSGGQLKRLAIAQEVVSKPRIIILDEPTSGLDSASCLQVVGILRKLTQQKPRIAIMATIHQPSFKILNLFHKMFVVAANGDCIYEDEPLTLVDHLSKHGLQMPSHYNPADYIMEVASGEHGIDVVQRLAMSHKRFYQNEFQEPSNAKRLSDLNSETNFPVFSHVFYLFQRNFLITIRDPFVFGLRFGSMVGASLFMTSLFGPDVGKPGGCPPKFDADFEPSQLDEIGDDIEYQIKGIYNNTGNIFFAVLMMMFSALMPTCLAFPKEMVAFKTEKANNWYDLKGFFFGKFAAEIPFQVALILIYWPMNYIIQSQYPEFWRFASIFVILLLVQFIAQTLGYIVGAVFMYNEAASVFLGPTICIIPFMLVSGVFIKVKSMSPAFSTISYFSYLRFAMEGTLVSLYGFDRCGTEASKKLLEGKEAFIVWMSAMLGIFGNGEEMTTAAANDTDYIPLGTPSEKFVEELIDTIAGDFISDRNEVRSAVMNFHAMEEYFLPRSLLILIVYLVIVRFLAYFVIHLRSKSKE